MTTPLSRAERETIIRTADDESAWSVYTASPVMARKLEKLCDALGIPLTRVGDWGWECHLPLAAVNLRRPTVLSAEERERRAARLRERAAVA